MANLILQLNGQTISPTPIVNQNYSFLDTPLRQGSINNISLNGFLTGYASVDDARNTITGIWFSGQFGTITISDTNNNVIYNWPNLYLESVSTDSNHFYSGSMVKYSARFKEFNVPSGVYDEVNSFAFELTEDGFGTVTHKVGAKGVKNSNGAFNNAVAFVKSFTGLNPFAPQFLPNGSGVLLTLSENINRLEGSYSVTELFKYNTGIQNNYLSTFSLNTSDVIENEYLLVDANLKLQTSPVYNNLYQIETGFPTVYSFLNSYGISTGLLIPYSMTVSRNSGANTVDIKTSFISGYSGADISGFFDYMVSLDNDLVLPKETWKTEGEFICKGPLSYRQQQLQQFKNNNGPNWDTFCSGLITGSPLFAQYHTGGNLMSAFNILDIKENTGLAQFSMSFTVTDGSEPGLPLPTYSVEVSPSIYKFEPLQSANIEGAVTIQDLQMRSRGKITINTTADYVTSGTLSYNTVSGIASQLATIYLSSGTVVKENFETGILNVSYSVSYLGGDTQATGITANKIAFSMSQPYSRQAGFLFGY